MRQETERALNKSSNNFYNTKTFYLFKFFVWLDVDFKVFDDPNTNDQNQP